MYSREFIEILYKRGIEGEKEIEEFLSPSPQTTYLPSLMNNLDESVGFILSEIRNNSRICIYGDYDADGITATALMVSILSHVSAEGQVGYYIPSRFEEGYGLNYEALKTIKEKGFDVVVTVDCGSVSANEVSYAREIGLKIVVTDHHSISDVMADGLVVNPREKNSSYPFTYLSGCGVAFKLAQAIQRKMDLPKRVLVEVLDLVAIGTIGDIMPLLGENRTLCKYGLRQLNTGQRFGLRKLVEAIGLNMGHLTSENVSFVIVPHLNASGRIEDASLAVKLLLAKEGNPNVGRMVEELINKNQERRRIQNETFEACLEIIGQEAPPFIVLNLDNGHEGITGIVAGKIKEIYNRPTIIFTPSGDEGEYLKGTGRSVEGINLYETLNKYKHLFERFGGHSGACGLLIKKENLTELRENLIEDMLKLEDEDPAAFERKYDIDIYMEDRKLTTSFSKEIDLMAPFGKDNGRPLIGFRDVTVGDVRYMGKQREHVKFYTENAYGDMVQWVLFGPSDEEKAYFRTGNKVNVLGSLDINVWNGEEALQVMIKKIEEAN